MSMCTGRSSVPDDKHTNNAPIHKSKVKLMVRSWLVSRDSRYKTAAICSERVVVMGITTRDQIVYGSQFRSE